MNKQKQCAYWTLTINEKAKCFNQLRDILDKLTLDNPNIEWSYIKHNADDDDLNVHYHLVIYFKGSVKRFSTLVNIFEGAHIETTNQQRYKRCIQYLIHKNNPEKQSYNQNEIISNIETSYLADILNGEGYDFELFQEEKLFDYFNEIYRDNNEITMQHFISRFGLSAISSYYFIIKDQIKDFINLMSKVEFRQNKLSIEDKAFNIYAKDLKQEFNLYKFHFNANIDFDTYKEQVYREFIDSIERGLINPQQIIDDFNKGVK